MRLQWIGVVTCEYLRVITWKCDKVIPGNAHREISDITRASELPH